MKKYFLIIGIISCLYSCNTSQESPKGKSELDINHTLASLYPINNQWLELQNLEWAKDVDEKRNFLHSEYYQVLKNDIYSRFCTDQECLSIDSTLQIKVTPNEGLSSILAKNPSHHFLFPIHQAWIVVTSLPNENLYNIKKLNLQLEEQWQTIFEKSRLDSLSKTILFSQVLGYNDQILAFHSNEKSIYKSGYIDLNNGSKKQADQQWSSLIIDRKSVV